ncbi:MurR/RpiR family transcriptional regulator [Vagococcus sp. BWB3-3]|uniref:MurR/RpiR family transcriptional regulator n=1 Tax=Vagococcus allomyrinae TaxID=2794353 RepID=A0A940SQR2_9ENTE|nr:MurR/RpiR family transcriptional regulator [Vagococcus allomyrinae]MBP1039987.1 MurR/RpiR family transcriptional regulator [Vagococcus allomyrinae]
MILQQLMETTNFTYQEQAIVDYIVKHPRLILESTAKDLAAKTYTSSATIVRFCKKLGFKGYPDFQLNFVKETAHLRDDTITALSKDLSNTEVSTYVENLYLDTVQQTKELLNKDTFNRVINLLIHIKKIDFYASDINFSRVQSTCIKLTNVGIHAQVFNALNEFYVSNLNPQDSVSIIVSHTGKNPTMIDAAYQLRKRQVKTIGITNKINKDLELICNESLYVFFSNNGSMSALQYGLSLEYLLDTIYACLVVKKGGL